jgi:hypothetical protein
MCDVMSSTKGAGEIQIMSMQEKSNSYLSNLHPIWMEATAAILSNHHKMVHSEPKIYVDGNVL